MGRSFVEAPKQHHHHHPTQVKIELSSLLFESHDFSSNPKKQEICRDFLPLGWWPTVVQICPPEVGTAKIISSTSTPGT